MESKYRRKFQAKQKRMRSIFETKSNLFWLLREFNAFEKRTLVERLGDSNNLLLSRLSLFQQLKGHIHTTPHRDRIWMLWCHNRSWVVRFYAFEGLAWFTIHYSAPVQHSWILVTWPPVKSCCLFRLSHLWRNTISFAKWVVNCELAAIRKHATAPCSNLVTEV
jgi:hypothetical protein